jgi:hypothetical protein
MCRGEVKGGRQIFWRGGAGGAGGAAADGDPAEFFAKSKYAVKFDFIGKKSSRKMKPAGLQGEGKPAGATG